MKKKNHAKKFNSQTNQQNRWFILCYAFCGELRMVKACTNNKGILGGG